jgi:PHS family inorganic phosphate transporter-like MFS transporter
MLTGIFSTLLLPETKQKSLEELSQESQEGFVKGVAAKIETKDGLVVAQTH